ncbi:helix-turn-helix transcriptional regulator [Mycobacterium sp. CnD-18-1]|uniref:helix-turn-helix domain-containing protein n=1 Tax=Mycobacterium sp. CnD-18-1 TaxID=2917744 RepID=UPI001EF20534|nr:helix-turn-helix transcriptional regulator [Mycobacterium sp. CnD-18-1]MCG7610387.1 helix-turn-helix domain-containing protein [Mycobacterium sp. CnD-18-1]
MSTATESYANPGWDFSDRIRKVRRSVARMTQAEMATELGVKQKAYAAWESGQNKPDDIVAVAKRIAFRWRGQVTASWVLGVEEDRGGRGPDDDGTSARPNQPVG